MLCKSQRDKDESQYCQRAAVWAGISRFRLNLSSGCSPSLLSAWIVAWRNSLSRKMNCGYLQKTTPRRQDKLELSLEPFIAVVKFLRASGHASRRPLRTQCEMH
jgi:hypothetical protein